MPKNSALIALALLALACDTVPSTHVRVATNGSTFDILSNPAPAGIGGASIPYEVTNLGEQTVYLPTCDADLAPVIDRSTGNGWEQYAAGFCLADQVRSATRVVKGDHRSGTATILEPGVYRIHFYYTTEHAESDDEASKAFEVR